MTAHAEVYQRRVRIPTGESTPGEYPHLQPHPQTVAKIQSRGREIRAAICVTDGQGRWRTRNAVALSAAFVREDTQTVKVISQDEHVSLRSALSDSRGTEVPAVSFTAFAEDSCSCLASASEKHCVLLRRIDAGYPFGLNICFASVKNASSWESCESSGYPPVLGLQIRHYSPNVPFWCHLRALLRQHSRPRKIMPFSRTRSGIRHRSPCFDQHLIWTPLGQGAARRKNVDNRKRIQWEGGQWLRLRRSLDSCGLAVYSTHPARQRLV